MILFRKNKKVKNPIRDITPLELTSSKLVHKFYHLIINFAITERGEAVHHFIKRENGSIHKPIKSVQGTCYSDEIKEQLRGRAKEENYWRSAPYYKKAEFVVIQSYNATYEQEKSVCPSFPLRKTVDSFVVEFTGRS